MTLRKATTSTTATIQVVHVIMYASSVIARGKAALQGTETEQRIAVLLYDDAVQVISSFELNQLASLTYHEAQVITSAADMTEILLDHLEQITKAPVNYSTVSVQKALVVARHILLHGAEKVVQPIRVQLGRPVEQLTRYNTVLLAQQQQAGAWLLRLKGGSVDRGGPVREAAVALHNLLQSPPALRYERSVSADPNSLVPVGSKQHVAFATDEVRFQHLKKQMEEQQKIIVKSNLKKANDGFGSGYMAKDGKAVVGAAHGIEEMLAMQQREEQKFRDEQQQARAASQQQQQQQANATAAAPSFSEYQAPSFSQPPVHNSSNPQNNPQQQPQYAQEQYHPQSAPAPAPEVDLLDFGNEATTASSAGITPATSSQKEDLLFGGDDTTTTVTSLPAAAAAETNYTAGSHDPFHVTVAPVQAAASDNSGSAVSGLLGMMSLGATASNNNNHPTTTPSVSISSSSGPANKNSMQPKSVMATSEDRFAALDALVGGGGVGLAPSSSSNGGTAAAAAATGTMPLNVSADGMSMNSGGTGMSLRHSGGVSSANAFSGLGSAGSSSSGAKDAFSGLMGSTFSTPAPAPSLSGLSAAKSQQQQQQQQNPISNAFSMPAQQERPAFAMPPDMSSIRVSDMGFASPPDSTLDDSENGFVMGGSSGAGLAPAPAVPPPPPPGGW